MTQYLKYISFFILGCIMTWGIMQDLKEIETIVKEKEIIKEIKVPVEPKGTIASLTMEDLYNDLKNRYPHISSKHRQEIMESIAKTADQYSISPLVLYSLIAVESSFRWWIKHPQVQVKSTETGKTVKTNAIGLGGIIYEIWGKELAKKGIIETKSDLYTIDKNIQSIGYVYSKLKSLKLHPKASNSIESGLIRYFGGGYKSYFNKINSEIVNLLNGKVYKWKYRYDFNIGYMYQKAEHYGMYTTMRFKRSLKYFTL